MNVNLRLVRLTPVEAELAVDVADSTLEVRGRLIGPICEYSTTIDVVYPIKANRILVPEPAWWDPESPFLYRGLFKCWSGNTKVHEMRIQIGFRHTTFDGTTFIHNGKRVALNCQRAVTANEAELRASRADGRNAVEVPSAVAEAACGIADRIGLFVLAQIGSAIDPLLHPSALTR